MDESSKIPITNVDATIQGIPKKYSEKVECAIQALLSAIDPHSESWELIYDKNGVVAKKRIDGAITVKSESVFPYLASEVFEVIMNSKIMKKIDYQTHALKTMKEFSLHTYIQYKQYKQVHMSLDTLHYVNIL